MRFATLSAALLTAALSVALPVAGASSEITGSVLEPNGDPSPYASLTFTQPATAGHREITRETTAGPDGKYRAADLSPGPWSVVAVSARTRSSVRVTVDVYDGQNQLLPLKLFSIWTFVEASGLPDIPLYGGTYLDAIRNASEITRGEEGGNIEGFGPYSPRGNFGVNSIGQRSQDNNFEVDGMDNNDAFLRGPVLNPPVDAIEAARLSAVYIPTDEGHSAGAVINVLTQSGSSVWHGSAFEYLANSALDAKNFFDGPVKPGLTQNRFGGSLGGPLRGRDWFFFLDSDFLRARDGLTVTSTVPTVAQKAGEFGATPIYDPSTITQAGSIQFIRQPFADNRIPLSRISPQALALIGLYPNPNLPGAADNFLYTPSAISNGERFGARTDKRLSSRNSLFGRINYERFNDISPSALPSGGNDPTQHADDANIHLTAFAAAVSESFAIRPSLVNSIHAGITRFDWNGVPLDSPADPSAALGIPGLPTSGGLPVVSPEGFTQLGAAENVPSSERSTTWELRDDVRWTTARHAFEFGAQAVRRYVDGNTTDWTSRSSFLFTPDYTSLPNVANTGDSIASLLLGDPSEVRRDVQFQPYQLRGWELAGFAQDHIRLWRRLTIEGGLRYSLDPPVTEADNRMVNFNFGRVSPALNQFGGQNGVNDYGGLSFNKLALAPRLAIAWDLSKDGSTVLRAAFSKDYDPGAYMAEGILARNPPYESRLDMFNGSLQTGPTLTAGVPPPSTAMLPDPASLNAAQGSIYAIEQKNYTPYVDQWGVTLERRLRRHLTLEIAGTSSMGIHLYESYDINAPFPAPTPFNGDRYPYYPYTSRVEYLSFAGGSTYYGGQAKLAGQLGSNLSLLITYRYAKSIDDSSPPETAQDSRPSTPQYLYNLRADRSVSPFDIPQRVVAMVSYSLPFRNVALANWRIDTLTTIQSGLPFTPELAVNNLNNGGYQLPNRIGPGALPSNERSYFDWFNTGVDTPGAAFATPALYQYGNSGFDILRGPGLATVDASLSRNFALREKLHLVTRVEAGNILNRTNLALPQRILELESSGVISHTATRAANVQLVARLAW